MDGSIRVKFVGRDPAETWLRQFPGRIPRWGNCQFIFDPDEEDFDWLVVYNDLPESRPEERLRGGRKHSLLVTSEPASIKCYGRAFTAQFGYVLTSQPEWALPHPGRIYSQPALQWFYGRSTERGCIDYDRMVAEPPLAKTRTIATVCSNKRQRHTLHNRRYQFVQQLKELIPELDVYGHGVRPMTDKAESLDSYRYHVAIENYNGLHHWTEKLADPFLGAALPFYSGCPNAADYFPPESFIPIDIRDPFKSAKIIRQSIDNDEYGKRISHLIKSRELILNTYNIFSVVSRLIENHNYEFIEKKRNCFVVSRRKLRHSNFKNFFNDTFYKIKHNIRNRYKNDCR